MSRKTALLIDDNEFYMDLLIEVLQEKDFEVLAFNDPLEFLSQKEDCCSAQIKPCADVVITDNQMPGMSGLDFLKMISDRGCKLPNRCKAIFSGDLSEEDHAQAQALGCKVFKKPTPIHDFWNWLDEEIMTHKERVCPIT